jgi:hypothetical protein
MFDIGFCMESPSILGKRRLQKWRNCYDQLKRERDAKSIESVPTIAELIRLNFDIINPSERSVRGTVFELCILDGLLRAGVDEQRITAQEPISDGVHVDFCVRPSTKEGITFFIPAKTSCRERWKQWDYEAAILKGREAAILKERVPPDTYGKFKIVGLFYSEDNKKRGKGEKGPNIQRAMQHQEKWARLCSFVDEVITILDINRTQELLSRVASQ